MARKPDTPCSGCGKMLWSGASSLPAGERRCRECRGHRCVPFADRATRAPRAPLPDRTTCGHCGEPFKPRRRDAQFCSLSCAGRSNGAARSAHYAAQRSGQCIEPGCTNPPRKSGKRIRSRCSPCDERTGDPVKRKARERRKTHIRKAKTRYADFTAEQEREMRAKAKRCPICSVRMVDAPYLPASKELDHIVPLNIGGTHTLGNVRIICRACNIRRPKDGSDYAGPVTLWAVA